MHSWYIQWTQNGTHFSQMFLSSISCKLWTIADSSNETRWWRLVESNIIILILHYVDTMGQGQSTPGGNNKGSKVSCLMTCVRFLQTYISSPMTLYRIIKRSMSHHLPHRGWERSREGVLGLQRLEQSYQPLCLQPNASSVSLNWRGLRIGCWWKRST